jgi:hypothetical protein
VATGRALEAQAGAPAKSEFDRLAKTLAARRAARASSAEGGGGDSAAVAPKKASLKDFAMGEEIGVGNFTRIMLATHKPTGELFALKLIQKSEVDRMKRRCVRSCGAPQGPPPQPPASIANGPSTQPTASENRVLACLHRI